MANTYYSLFAEKNRKDWKKNALAGLKAFLKESLDITWNGSSMWSCNQGCVNCDFTAKISLHAVNEGVIYKVIEKEIKNNPFLSEYSISEIFASSLKNYLDTNFDEYCTSDEYYEPVAEDFEVTSYVENWCKDNGFELVSIECNGNTGEFISNY